VRKLGAQRPLQQLNDVFPDTREELEAVTVRVLATIYGQHKTENSIPAIPGREIKPLPFRILANEQVRIRRIRAPAHGAVKQFLVREFR
jgi:hypothetical protein